MSDYGQFIKSVEQLAYEEELDAIKWQGVQKILDFLDKENIRIDSSDETGLDQLVREVMSKTIGCSGGAITYDRRDRIRKVL